MLAFTLAEKAGIVEVDDMLEQMTADLFMEWQAFYRWKNGETGEDETERNFAPIEVWNSYLKGLK